MECNEYYAPADTWTKICIFPLCDSTFYFSLSLVREQEQASDFTTEKEPQHD